MKKLFALLLVLCMVFGLIACGTPSNDNGTNETGNGTNNGTNSGTNNGGSSNGGASSNYTPTGNFQGKTIQIWGYASDMYNDFTNMGKGNYIWMIRAAVAEWAELNGVTVQYIADYDQQALLSSISNGDKPDLLFLHDSFPSVANVGLVKALTEEQQNQVKQIVDERWLDCRRTMGDVYGVLYPWTAPSVCYYNKSMFERYDVKTPREYFEEGKWNYTALKEIMEDLSRDLDGDGVKDTYAMSSYTAVGLCAKYVENDDGTISHTLDTQQTFDMLSFLYEYYTQKQCIAKGIWNIASNVTYPMFALQFSDAEFYNFEHLYTTLKNGDKIEVVPLPYYDADGTSANTTISYWSAGMHLLKSCDEDEAVMDLICFILRCGMKYLEDYSLGLVETDYEGITGASDYSAKWLKKFEAVCSKREKDLAKLEDYDEEYVKSLLDYEANATSYASGAAYIGTQNYFEWTNPKFASVIEVPPASSIPLIRSAVESMVQQYNDLYAPKN